MSQLNKALEIKTSMLLKLVFASNTIYHAFFLDYLPIFLIPAANAKTFNPTTELTILKNQKQKLKHIQ